MIILFNILYEIHRQILDGFFKSLFVVFEQIYCYLESSCKDACHVLNTFYTLAVAEEMSLSIKA